MNLHFRGWRSSDLDLIQRAWWSHQLLAGPTPHPWSHVTEEERQAVLTGGLDGRLWMTTDSRAGAALLPIDWEQRTARLQLFLAEPFSVAESAELLRQAFRLATEHLNLVRVTGYLDPTNRSGRLAARCAGFVREAALRREPGGQLLRLLYGRFVPGEVDRHG